MQSFPQCRFLRSSNFSLNLCVNRDIFVLRNLTLKFGQNQVSNRGYVADVVIVIVVDVVVVLLLIPENYFLKVGKN